MYPQWTSIQYPSEGDGGRIQLSAYDKWASKKQGDGNDRHDNVITENKKENHKR